MKSYMITVSVHKMPVSNFNFVLPFWLDQSTSSTSCQLIARLANNHTHAQKHNHTHTLMCRSRNSPGEPKQLHKLLIERLPTPGENQT